MVSLVAFSLLPLTIPIVKKLWYFEVMANFILVVTAMEESCGLGHNRVGVARALLIFGSLSFLSF